VALFRLRRGGEERLRELLGQRLEQPLDIDREPLPALLAVFEKQDAIEGQFDEESQGMLEVTPEPNLIIRLNGEDVESVRDAFDRLAACCETLACARRLIKMMPGNERPD